MKYLYAVLIICALALTACSETVSEEVVEDQEENHGIEVVEEENGCKLVPINHRVQDYELEFEWLPNEVEKDVHKATTTVRVVNLDTLSGEITASVTCHTGPGPIIVNHSQFLPSGKPIDFELRCQTRANGGILKVDNVTFTGIPTREVCE